MEHIYKFSFKIEQTSVDVRDVSIEGSMLTS